MKKVVSKPTQPEQFSAESKQRHNAFCVVRVIFAYTFVPDTLPKRLHCNKKILKL
ncbi:unknown [Corallococcus sp. CAG:1435]|nr:unknown [Corallococcus sp. CAG:1435]